MNEPLIYGIGNPLIDIIINAKDKDKTDEIKPTIIKRNSVVNQFSFYINKDISK